MELELPKRVTLLSKISPFEVITSEEEKLSFFEKLQITGFEVWGIFENQIEKVKRFWEFGMGKKPAVKLVFGEIKVLFCEGSHGEFEMLKDVIFCCCWEIEG